MLAACSVPAPSRLADALAQGLRAELDLTPKPGLVDRRDAGSHPDLSHGLMCRSIALLAGYFERCAGTLEAGGTVEDLRALGVAAEQRMQAAFGTNTHRGAIFLGGLLLAGAHEVTDRDPLRVRRGLSAAARRLFASRLPTGTVGATVRTRYQVGGIVDEACRGLPGVFEVGVPALASGAARGFDERRSRLLAMACLMQQVVDTTALRRCGQLGLARVRRDGDRLERLLLDGRCPDAMLARANRDYRRCRLTMGGVADLLAMSIGWAAWAGHPPPAACRPVHLPGTPPAAALPGSRRGLASPGRAASSPVTG